MSTFTFDANAIMELAGRIALLADQLRDSGGLPAIDAEQAGGAEVSRRVADFVHHWSDGMDRIVGELENTTDLLKEAAAEYAATDAAVERGVAPASEVRR